MVLFYTETNGYQCCYSSLDWIALCLTDGGNTSGFIYIGTLNRQAESFFRVQNVALSQRLYLKQIEHNETVFKDKVSIFNKQKYMHGIFLRKTLKQKCNTFKEFLNEELDTLEENS